MAGVRGAIQELRVQQTNLQADIEKIDAEIKQAQNENYEVCIYI